MAPKQSYWKTVPGWFNFTDVYRDAVAAAPSKAIMVEAGVFLGRSLCMLLEAAAHAKKDLQIHGIDQFTIDTYFGQIITPWKESAADWAKRCGPEILWETAQKHIYGCPWKTCLKGLHRCTTIEGARKFEPHSVFFLFLDANHTYEHVIEDLEAWLPKMTAGGILAGHDLNSKGYGCGVRKALDEFVQRHALRYTPVGPNSWRIIT